jgi:hypothetical protein
MTSAVLFSRQLRHIKANPKVAIALTDPVGVRAEPFARATIQADATIIEDDLHAGWETLLPRWRAKEPVIDGFVKKRFGIPLLTALVLYVHQIPDRLGASSATSSTCWSAEA